MVTETNREASDPLELKVNPRKWTTKVNVAIVIAVLVVLVIGAIYAFSSRLDPPERVEDSPASLAP